MDEDSKALNWKWVIADEILARGPCELHCANLSPSAANATATLYHGENTTGDIIGVIFTAVKTNWDFVPKKPVYCPKGLFIDIGANVTGVFVQWREFKQ